MRLNGDFPMIMHETFNSRYTHPPLIVEQPPLPQEVLTPVPLDNQNRFAFKTGFGRYLTTERDGCIRGIAEAYGPTETFELVFQDNKLAIQAVSHNKFLSIDHNGILVATESRATAEHMVNVRCNRDISMEVKRKELNKLSKEEHGSLWEAERNYSRKFQSWIGGTIRLNAASEKDLVKARNDGLLHSVLLDRRSVMKNDKYCK